MNRKYEQKMWEKGVKQCRSFIMCLNLNDYQFRTSRFSYRSTYINHILLSCFSRVRLCAILLTAAHQVPRALGFCRQEHWSGLPFPSPVRESEK